MQSATVPINLEIRDSNNYLYLLICCGFSFLILGLARLSNPKALKTIVSVYLKSEGIEQTLKENMRINSTSAVLLNVSYFLSFSLCLHLLLSKTLRLAPLEILLLCAAIPFSIFTLETFGIVLMGWITGEKKRLGGLITNVIIGNAMNGLILCVLSLIWVMNPNMSIFFEWIFLFVISQKLFIRITKNSMIVLSNGVSWYYLILYFCTLEILPLLVAYYEVTKILPEI